MSSRKVTCTICGKETGETEEQINSNLRPCPHCGSMKKTVHIFVHDDIKLDVKESLRGKVKDDSYRSKDKLRKDFFHGNDLHKKTGKWYRKERLIDKDNDHYKEIVTDLETGVVIHECDEPLSEHINHGSAKKIEKKA